MNLKRQEIKFLSRMAYQIKSYFQMSILILSVVCVGLPRLFAVALFGSTLRRDGLAREKVVLSRIALGLWTFE